jgi:hypothetical protein
MPSVLLLLTSCRAAQIPGPPPAFSRKKFLGDADKQATLEAGRAVAGLSEERKIGMRRQAQQPPTEEQLAAAREAAALQAEADERAREAAAEDELVCQRTQRPRPWGAVAQIGGRPSEPTHIRASLHCAGLIAHCA